MATRKYSAREYIVSIAVAAGLLLIAWTISKGVWNVFEAFAIKNPTLGAPIIAGAFTVIGGLAVVMVGRKFERKKELEAAHRQKQTEVFEKLIKAMMSVILAEDGERTSDSLTVSLRELTPGLILWAKAPSLAAYRAFFRIAGSEEKLLVKLNALEDFFLALRTDLGLSNDNIGRGDLLRLFITDYDLHVK